MKSYKRLFIAGLTLAGLIFLFFPVMDAEREFNVIQMLALWKVSNIEMAIWMSSAIGAAAIAVSLLCMGTGKRSLITTFFLLVFSFGSILAAPWVYQKRVSLPEWGEIGALISLGIAMVLSVILTVIKEETKENTVEDCISNDGSGIKEDQPVLKINIQAQEENTEEVEKNALQPSHEEVRKGILNVWCGEYNGSSIELNHMESVSLGRSMTDCNLVIEDASVSRKHCTITYNAVNNTYLLLDTSSNGTYLEGGQRIPKNFAMEVQPKLKFYIGKPENEFSLG